MGDKTLSRPRESYAGFGFGRSPAEEKVSSQTFLCGSTRACVVRKSDSLP